VDKESPPELPSKHKRFFTQIAGIYGFVL